MNIKLRVLQFGPNPPGHLENGSIEAISEAVAIALDTPLDQLSFLHPIGERYEIELSRMSSLMSAETVRNVLSPDPGEPDCIVIRIDQSVSVPSELLANQFLLMVSQVLASDADADHKVLILRRDSSSMTQALRHQLDVSSRLAVLDDDGNVHGYLARTSFEHAAYAAHMATIPDDVDTQFRQSLVAWRGNFAAPAGGRARRYLFEPVFRDRRSRVLQSVLGQALRYHGAFLNNPQIVFIESDLVWLSDPLTKAADDLGFSDPIQIRRTQTGVEGLDSIPSDRELFLVLPVSFEGRTLRQVVSALKSRGLIADRLVTLVVIAARPSSDTPIAGVTVLESSLFQRAQLPVTAMNADAYVKYEDRLPSSTAARPRPARPLMSCDFWDAVLQVGLCPERAVEAPPWPDRPQLVPNFSALVNLDGPWLSELVLQQFENSLVESGSDSRDLGDLTIITQDLDLAPRHLSTIIARRAGCATMHVPKELIARNAEGQPGSGDSAGYITDRWLADLQSKPGHVVILDEFVWTGQSLAVLSSLIDDALSDSKQQLRPVALLDLSPGSNRQCGEITSLYSFHHPMASNPKAMDDIATYGRDVRVEGDVEYLSWLALRVNDADLRTMVLCDLFFRTGFQGLRQFETPSAQEAAIHIADPTFQPLMVRYFEMMDREVTLKLPDDPDPPTQEGLPGHIA